MIKQGVVDAYIFAKDAHEGQLRKFTSLPYFSHPKYVARLVEDFVPDNTDMVISALLHDVVEDTHVDLQTIYNKFGDHVGDLVQELTSIKPSKMSKRRYLLEKMNGMSEEALIIKLADRLHNVQFLESDGVVRTFIKRYVEETNFIMLRLDNHLKNALVVILRDRIMENVTWLCKRYEFDLEDK